MILASQTQIGDFLFGIIQFVEMMIRSLVSLFLAGAVIGVAIFVVAVIPLLILGYILGCIEEHKKKAKIVPPPLSFLLLSPGSLNYGRLK
jgi:hypothetical protein